MGIFGKYFSIIFAFIVVLIILLFTTKYLAYKSKKMLKGNYMQIVESLSLGVSNRLHLIKVDKEFFIISATNKNVEFLARVNINDYEDEEIKNPISEVIDFKAVLKKYITGINFSNQAKKKTEVEADNISGQKPKDTDEFQNSDITFKKNLEKLKHLTKTINGRRSEDEQKKEN
ncbi:MAG: flagellar biosynthetic protein FliO [Ruminiclostridium sp.]